MNFKRNINQNQTHIDEYCKCCNTKLTPNTINRLFDAAGLKLDIKYLLFSFLKIVIVQEENKNAAVCDNCLKQLIDSNKFKQNCLENIQRNSDTNGKTKTYKSKTNHTNVSKIAKASVTENNDEIDELVMYSETFTTTIDECNDFAANDNTINEESDIIVEEILYDEIIDENYDIDELIDENYDISDNDEKYISDNDTNKIEDKEMDFAASFIDSITISSIKKRLISGIPNHMKLIEKSLEYVSNENDKQQSKIHIDVAKIRTSEDLMNILEDDYERDNDHKKRCLNRDTCDVFKIPKINITNENDDFKTFDFDQYFESIIKVTYNDLQLFTSNVFCMFCKDNDMKLENVKELHRHTFANHINNSKFLCILSEICGSFDSVDALNNHLITDHQNIIE